MKCSVIRTAAAIVILGVVSASVACSDAAPEQMESTAVVTVAVEPASRGTFVQTTEVMGTVVPAPGADWVIAAPERARIVELPWLEGARVKTGDVLVRFEIPSLPADLAARRADLSQAGARVETTKAAVARLTGLFERGVASAREVEEARRDQAEADAALAQAQSAVVAASSLADRAIVRATFAGVIARRWHNPGDIVEGAATDPVLRVIDPAQLQVVAAVPLADLPQVQTGQPAEMSAPGASTSFAGRVLSRPAAVDPGSATADVRISAGAASHLPAGTPVHVTLETRRQVDAISVQAVAVVRANDATFVFVVGDDGKAHRKAVTLGLASGTRIEVRTGISAGDLVIVRGHDGLPDGAAVTVEK